MSVHTPAPVRLCVLAALSATALALAAACGNTIVEHSWARPGQPLDLRRVTTIAITKNGARRELLEEAMAGEIQRQFPAVVAVPSHTVIDDRGISDEEAARTWLGRAGFDGWVVLRVTDVTRKDVYVPGAAIVAPTPYRTFWGYYHYWAPIAYEPGYVERERNVQVETEVFDAHQGDLVYSAVSRSVDPSSQDDLVRNVAHVVCEDMKEKGVIADLR